MSEGRGGEQLRVLASVDRRLGSYATIRAAWFNAAAAAGRKNAAAITRLRSFVFSVVVTSGSSFDLVFDEEKVGDPRFGGSDGRHAFATIKSMLLLGTPTGRSQCERSPHS